MVKLLDSKSLCIIIKDLSYSGLISQLLADKELGIVALAVFLAEVSLEKNPEFFNEVFIREGVVHELYGLATKYDKKKSLRLSGGYTPRRRKSKNKDKNDKEIKKKSKKSKRRSKKKKGRKKVPFPVKI